jgi:DNA-binding Lrp family transcriptional regulator
MPKNDKPRSDSGEWQSTVTEADILTAVNKHSPAATSEVADEIDMTRQGADARLRRLHTAGSVEKKKIGASLVWFVDSPENTETSNDTGADADADADEGNSDMPTMENDTLDPSAVREDLITE